MVSGFFTLTVAPDGDIVAGGQGDLSGLSNVLASSKVIPSYQIASMVAAAFGSSIEGDAQVLTRIESSSCSRRSSTLPAASRASDVQA